MSERTWERIGALSGLKAAVLFGAAFVIFLTTDPMGTPRVPDIANAADASAFIGDHQDALKVQLLLNSAAILAFLWFLGSLWSRLRAAEGGPARVSAIASAGGIVGAAAVLAGIVCEATAVLLPTGVDVTTLYVLSVMSIGLGGAAFTVFFLAAGKVILQTRALPVVVGALALVAAAASALGLVSIFVDEGIFNAATGAFGFWVRFGAFVIWVALASIVLTATVGRGATRTARTRR
jgi:hypothetical protein